jgi:hypothetical protein
MHISRRTLLAASVVLATLVLSTATALAAGPATGSVRVEGLAHTLLAPTQVTTATAPVIKDGNPAHACEGTSALGALQVATAGNWVGHWESSFGQYFVDGIEGETHLFEAGVRSYYWSFWLNDRFEETGPCDVPFEAGDRVLFFPICDEACPAGPEPVPLEIEAPAVANVGESVPVAVKQYSAKAEASPAVGAAIAWAGGSTMTDSQGHANVAFNGAGNVELQVSGSEAGPPAVRTETFVCVHSGNDGTCGTTASAATSSGAAVSGASGTLSYSAVSPYKGPYAVVARIGGLREHHVYPRRHAPRLLTGTVSAHVAVTSVSIALRRRHGDRCFAYSGVRERFARSRCGTAPFFRVSTSSSFSYLLPAPLPPGRYVLDVEASDAAGNHTALARGTSRIVFYVR